jgi:FkbM family methyltransferase
VAKATTALAESLHFVATHRLELLLDRARAAVDLVRLRRRVGLLPYERIARIGSKYGGWAVPDDRLGPESICYCVGIGEDISFDIGLVERYGCSVHSFDPTPVAVAYIDRVPLPEGLQFHSVGLWSSDGELVFHAPKNRAHASYSALNLQDTEETVRCPVKRLVTVMSELGHDHLDLLKIDIEGAEFEVISSLLADEIDVDTICVEFHRDAGGIGRIIRALERLRADGWLPIAEEGWNFTLIHQNAHSASTAASAAAPDSRKVSSIGTSSVARFSDHYVGERGSDYFRWQNEVGEIGAELNFWKFADHVKPEDSVVDFGCGNGALLARVTAATKVGVEVNPAARRAATKRGLRVVASAAELAPESADVVISNHALEHTLNPLSELQALLSALRPGGVIVLWLPLDDWRSQRRYEKDRNHHLYAWTPLLLGNLLYEAGFEHIESRVVTRAWLMFYRPLARVLPRPLYLAITVVTAALKRRRQLVATARRPL